MRHPTPRESHHQILPLTPEACRSKLARSAVATPRQAGQRPLRKNTGGKLLRSIDNEADRRFAERHMPPYTTSQRTPEKCHFANFSLSESHPASVHVCRSSASEFAPWQRSFTLAHRIRTQRNRCSWVANAVGANVAAKRLPAHH